MKKSMARSGMLAALAASALLAACGSSGGTSSGTPAASPGSPAQAVTSAPTPPTAPPTQLGVTTKLPKAPPKGLTVAWAECALPSCSTFTPAFQSAAKALGWNLKVYTYKSGAPAPAIQEAVSNNVNAIVITGEPTALFKPQLAAAHAKHIPVISADDITPPDQATGLMTQFGDASMFGNEGVQLAEWMLHQSGDKAHIAYVNIPDYPILNAGYAALKTTVAKYCPKACSVDQIALNVAELGAGKAPSTIIAYLQSHPDVNYLDFSFADLLTGVQPALKAAGLAGKVKLTGQALGNAPAVIAGLKDGSIAAWVAQPNYYQAWLQMDAAARLAVGATLTQERAAALLPTWVVDSAASAGPLTALGGWDGPLDYQAKFKALWGVA
jgi:ABC-type sugar transport system substrate-binding protein